eukprot:351652-Chlamydomonas_euryale.AAC.4
MAWDRQRLSRVSGDFVPCSGDGVDTCAREMKEECAQFAAAGTVRSRRRGGARPRRVGGACMARGVAPSCLPRPPHFAVAFHGQLFFSAHRSGLPTSQWMQGPRKR